MKAEVQEALVQSWRVAERLGRKTPTNAQVFAFVRLMGHSFKDIEAKRLLAKFRAPQPGTGAAPEPHLDAPDAHLDLSTNAPDAPGAAPEPHRSRTNRAGATRAGVVPNPIPSSIMIASGRPLTEPWGLADWFFGRAKSLALIGEHVDQAKWIGRELKSAQALLANGPDECVKRGERFLAAHKAGRIKGSATLRGLVTAFDWNEIRTDRPTVGSVPAIGVNANDPRENGGVAYLPEVWALFDDADHEKQVAKARADTAAVRDLILTKPLPFKLAPLESQCSP